MRANAELGRLRIRKDLGDTDGDGDIDQIYAYGGRKPVDLQAECRWHHHQGARHRR
jgi:hypothetical protein